LESTDDGAIGTEGNIATVEYLDGPNSVLAVSDGVLPGGLRAARRILFPSILRLGSPTVPAVVRACALCLAHSCRRHFSRGVVALQLADGQSSNPCIDLSAQPHGFPADDAGSRKLAVPHPLPKGRIRQAGDADDIVF
jgi:hypothetical protein